MNKTRRKELTAIKTELETVYDKLAELKERVERCNDDEVECQSNMPDSLRETERFVESENAIDAMSEADHCFDTILGEFEELYEHLASAVQ